MEAFRDHDRQTWLAFRKLGSGYPVKQLQHFLLEVGFMPNSHMDGIFSYVTQASVRLLREYVQRIEGDTSIGHMDEIVGVKTRKHIDRWDERERVANWHGASHISLGYGEWIKLLLEIKKFYLEKPSLSVQKVSELITIRFLASLPIQESEFKKD